MKKHRCSHTKTMFFAREHQVFDGLWGPFGLTPLKTSLSPCPVCRPRRIRPPRPWPAAPPCRIRSRGCHGGTTGGLGFAWPFCFALLRQGGQREEGRNRIDSASVDGLARLLAHRPMSHFRVRTVSRRITWGCF